MQLESSIRCISMSANIKFQICFKFRPSLFVRYSEDVGLNIHLEHEGE